MKTLKTVSALTILSVLFIFISCSSSDDSESDPKTEVCTKTCDKGFVLNTDSCECEKEVCTKTCDGNFILNADTCECEEFIAKVIEVDASVVTLTEDWKKRTTIADYTGEGYIVWEGPGQTWKGNIGEVGKLTYTIDVPKAGTYLFQWRSYIAKKADVDPWAEHNDSWLKFPDADDFFAERVGGSILYPKGSGKSPNPAGENGNGFFKIYMNDVDKWSITTSTSDSNAHQIYVTFNEAKAYTVEIAARSDFHAIDSFRLTEQKP
ncbi:hypothetical protein [Flavivirga rizhaonensis]|uniref:Uncharacterized protein n=1 Tax=Flavivirga rizhaonensis TaxID=2559571 RepID=A0A4S1DX23_9FLAO|nr:hypothetical protein [Flavivirga rizhaonensis]TGV02609.1 hypothetical protein EM932_10575 [Flavivirga rizhaonensis]